MVRLRDWILAGAVIPAALVVLSGLVVAVSMGLDDAVQTLGAILLSLLLLMPPGAALGALLGLIVLAFARRLPARGEPRRPAALTRASLVAGIVALGVSAILIRFTASDGLSVPQILAYSVAFATIPTALAAITFRRWRPVLVPPVASCTTNAEDLP